MRMSNGTAVLLYATPMVALSACAKTDKGAAADSTTPAAAASAPAPAAWGDFAGDWNMRAVPETGNDTTPTEFVLHAPGDSTGWKAVYKNGPTLPLKVALSGDSVITDTPEHMSVRGKGVNVTTRAVYRRNGDTLVGRITAHYRKGADSVLMLRARGTKGP